MIEGPVGMPARWPGGGAPATFDLVADLIEDAANGWSIGSFGAVAEFHRDADEPVALRRGSGAVEIFTDRGGLRIAASAPLHALAWDSLAADGEGWSHALAFCVPRPAGAPPRVVRALGADADAIRAADRGALLFDLGIGCGAVAMAVRTADPALVAALSAAEGQALFDVPGIFAALLAAQPHRVALSPLGRVEVYAPIPPADGKSPEGPHTHVLPKPIALDRPHGANVPIPDGWQAALTLHPPAPWRGALDPGADAAFRPLLDRFAAPADEAVERDLLAAIERGEDWWPADRRGRTRARILLRRRHAAGDARVAAWRARHDRLPPDRQEGEAP